MLSSSHINTSKEALPLNAQQQKAFDLVTRNGRNVFVTGPGGVGKSHLIREISAHLTKTSVPFAITAPTGVAALAVGGSTIQSLFKIPLYITRLEHVRNEESGGLTWMIPTNVKINVKKLRILIIDEISMLNSDLLEVVDFLCKNIHKEHNMAFGGMQVVFIGDFFQLPPVPDNEDQIKNKKIMMKQGKIVIPKYSFFSQVWKACNLETIYLHQSFRQLDKTFFRMLSELRVGNVTNHSSLTLAESSIPNLKDERVKNATVLFSSNYEKDAYNEDKLEELHTPGKCYTSRFSCSHPDRESIERYFENIPDELYLKVGAKVIVTKNMNLKEYNINVVNGDGGIVVGLGGPVLRQSSFFDYDDDDVMDSYGYATVVLDRFRHIGPIKIPYSSWEAYDPDFPGCGIVIAKFFQLPLIHGWAVTIHKSQGLTLDAVCISFQTIFLPGQAYVALSRARTLEGITVYNFDAYKIKACPAVVKFYKKCGLLDQDLFKEETHTPFPLPKVNVRETGVKDLKLDLLSLRDPVPSHTLIRNTPETNTKKELNVNPQIDAAIDRLISAISSAQHTLPSTKERSELISYVDERLAQALRGLTPISQEPKSQSVYRSALLVPKLAEKPTVIPKAKFNDPLPGEFPTLTRKDRPSESLQVDIVIPTITTANASKSGSKFSAKNRVSLAGGLHIGRR